MLHGLMLTTKLLTPNHIKYHLSTTNNTTTHHLTVNSHAASENYHQNTINVAPSCTSLQHSINLPTLAPTNLASVFGTSNRIWRKRRQRTRTLVSSTDRRRRLCITTDDPNIVTIDCRSPLTHSLIFSKQILRTMRLKSWLVAVFLSRIYKTYKPDNFSMAIAYSTTMTTYR